MTLKADKLEFLEFGPFEEGVLKNFGSIKALAPRKFSCKRLDEKLKLWKANQKRLKSLAKFTFTNMEAIKSRLAYAIWKLYSHHISPEKIIFEQFL